MSCCTFEPELVAYHFGVVAPERRDALEQHLLACPACLADFVALKRAIETAAEAEDERPSELARARLRGAVAAELGIREPAPRRWSWWERPLAFGVAAAVLAAAVLVLRLLAASPGAPPRTLLLEHSATITAPGRDR